MKRVGRRADDVFEHRRVGARLVARLALDEHEPLAAREAVLAGVVGERHARVGADPLELAPEAERGREADRARLAVAQPDRRHRRHDGAARRVT